MKTIRDIPKLQGKHVLLRMPLNVPVDASGNITDDFRIQKALPTIEFLRQKGAKIIVLSHIGREPEETLRGVAAYLNTKFPLTFIEDIMSEEAKEKVAGMAEGDVIIFENLRRWPGETANDPDFAKHLASFGDLYIDDDFPAAHRAHASITGIAEHLPSYAGFQFTTEVEQLSKVFNPEHPFLFILGGAKVETKLPLLEKITKQADTVFVGGVLANDFLKAKGINVGKSVTSKESVPADLLHSESLFLPADLRLKDGGQNAVGLDEVGEEDMIYDIGPKSVEMILEKIKDAKLILWNGPLGFCEKGFCKSTEEVARAVAESEGYSIIGGGDTIAALPSAMEEIDFISTGGGAMLDFLANQTLPGIEVLQ